MKFSNWLHNLFYSLQLLHEHCKYPRLYWSIYAISIIHLFVNIQNEFGSIWLPSLSKVASLQSLILEPVVFGYLIAMIGLQIIGFIILMYLGRNGNIKKSNFTDIFMTFLFWVCFINFTLNLGICAGFEDNTFKSVSITGYSLVFIANLFLINCTLKSKRIWIINQMLMIDIIRVLLLWTNDNRVLLIIFLVLYLLTSLGILFFRPVFHLSSNNRIAQMIASLTFSLALVSIAKIASQTKQSVTLLQLTASILAICLLLLMTQKWLSYKISKLYSRSFTGQKAHTNHNDNLYSMMELLLIHFLHENFSQYQDKIQLLMLDHVTRCKRPQKCNCNQVLQAFMGTKAKPDLDKQNKEEKKNQNKISPQNVSQQKSQHFLVQSSETTKNTKEFQEAYSSFVLITIGNYLSENAEMSLAEMLVVTSLEKVKEVKRKAVHKKSATQLKKSQMLKNSMILQYIRLETLLNSMVNLNSAYTTLKQLEFELKSNNILLSQESGILAYFNQQIVLKKLISMQTPNESTNLFCVKYFDSQKATNDLWEAVVTTVEEIKTFWTQIRIDEPDEKKVLSAMSRIYKHHNKILSFYEEISQNQERQTLQVVMIFRLYQELLQLQGQYRFFGTNKLIGKEEQKIKQIGSVNKKLYLSGTQTHTVSFSIDDQTFGDVKYMSTGIKDTLKFQFTNIKAFVPYEFQSSHTQLIKKFLQKDLNYYRHSINDPCYMKLDQNIIKPVYLEVHLLPFLSKSQIQMSAFFKPLVDDCTLLKKGITKNYGLSDEQNAAICINKNGKIVGWTQKFETLTNSSLSQVQIEEFLTQTVIQNLVQGKKGKYENVDEDYQLSLVKLISKFQSNQLYVVEIRSILDGSNLTQGEKYRGVQIIPSQLEQINQFNKLSPSQTISTQIAQNIQIDLAEVQKFDEAKKKINNVWDMASRPDKHSFKKKWCFLSTFFVVTFCGLILTTTFFLHQRIFDFIQLNDLLSDFGQNQISTAQSITYLRQINIILFTGKQDKIPQIPLIVEEVDRLKKVMYQKITKLSPYLGDIEWICIQILASGRRFIRQEKAFMLLTGFILKTINNIVNNLRNDLNTFNFTVVRNDIPIPYTETQNNFLELSTNAFVSALPSLARLRQDTINTFFLSVINEIDDQPSFQVPMAGIGICFLLIVVIYFKNWQLSRLTESTFKIFSKLDSQFSIRKIQQSDKSLNAIKQSKALSTDKLSKSKKIAWRQLSKVLERQSDLSEINSVEDKINDKINQIEKSGEFNMSEYKQKQLQPSESNRYTNRQETGRQLFKGFEITQRNSQNSKVEKKSNQFERNHPPQAEIIRKMQFTGDAVLYKTCHRKIIYLWAIIPVIVYFSHIVFISLQFNKFMEEILMLQNKLLQRQEALTTAWNYQYELGLYQGPADISGIIVQRVDDSYANERMLDFYQIQTQKYIFGRLQYYKRASEIFSTGNVCQSLNLLEFRQPSFATNFTKTQCETLSNGILKKGTKQATVGMMEAVRTLMIDNKMSRSFSTPQRLEYLKDNRIQTFNKIYSFIMAANNYITNEFQKDFKYFLQFYKMFVILDGPLMIIIAIGMISVYLRQQYRRVNKQTAIISCCFLVIGHGTFLRQPALLEDKETQSSAQRYELLK